MSSKNPFFIIRIFCLMVLMPIMVVTVHAQATRFVVTEAGGDNPIGTTPIKAGDTLVVRIVAVDDNGNVDVNYAERVTLALPEPKVRASLVTVASDPFGLLESAWAKVTVPASDFVGGVADNVSITVRHAGTRDRRITVTDGNIATYNAAGRPVAYVVVNDAGSGYVSPPTVTFVGGNGTGAQGVAIISGGKVTGITVTDEGRNYTSAPTVTLNGGGGSGANVQAYIYSQFSVGPARFDVTLSGTSLPLNSFSLLQGRTLPVRVRAVNADGTTAESYQGEVTLTSNAISPSFPSVSVDFLGVYSNGVVDNFDLDLTDLASDDSITASDLADGGTTSTANASSTFNVVATATGNALAAERLAISGVTVGQTVYPGGSASVQFTATNPKSGQAATDTAPAIPSISVSGPMDFLIVLSSSAGTLISESIVQYTSTIPGSVTDDTGRVISGLIPIPADVAPGTYTVKVYAGLTGSLGSGSFSITGGPDLAFSRFEYSPGQYRGGDALRFDLVWSNLLTSPGSSAINSKVPLDQDYRVEIHLSPNPVFGDTDDILVWQNSYSGNGAAANLLAGQSVAISDEFMLPKNVPGTYYLLVKVNSSGGREANFSSGFTEIEGPAPGAVLRDGNNVVLPREDAKITLLPIQAPDTTRVSVTTSGAQSAGLSDHPDVSQDGRYVFFHSYGGLDNGGAGTSIANIYVRDSLLNTTVLVSKSSFGGVSTGSSLYPKTNSDGRYVVYQSDATNLVTGDTNGYTDIFITDLIKGTTRRIVGAQQPNQSSYLPDISGDGRFIVFESTATNLVSGANPQGLKQIYLYDRDVNGSGTFDVVGNTALTLVSKTTANVTGTGASVTPQISRDGNYIAFTTSAPNLISGSSSYAQIVRRHRVTGDLVTVSAAVGGVLANGESGYPVINADGLYVAYSSRAKSLTPDTATVGVPHLFRAKIVANAITEVVRVNGISGNEPNNPALSVAPDLGSFEPAISDDGTLIAFVSESTNLLPPVAVRHIDRISYQSPYPQNYEDRNRAADVYVADLSDLAAPKNTRVSVSRFGYEATLWTVTGLATTQIPQSRFPAMSGDGRFVTFSSDAKDHGALVFGPTNFDYVATNGVKDIYLYNSKTGLSDDPSDMPAVTLAMAPSLTVTANLSLPLVAEITNAVRPITQVEFYADGTLVATVTTPVTPTSPRYVGEWLLSNLGILAARTYEISAIAVDSAGMRSPLSNVSQVTVTPIVGLLPNVIITNPSTSTFTVTNASSLLMQATATDSDGSVASVGFYIDGELVTTASADGGFAYRGTYTTTPLTLGDHVLTARVTDNIGNTVISSPVTLNVVSATQPMPSVTVAALSPTITAGQSVTIKAAATPAQGERITRVQIYANGSLIANIYNNTDPAQPPISRSNATAGVFTITVPFTPDAGTYNIYAVASDFAGNIAVSNISTLSVTAPSGVVPTVVIASPVASTGAATSTSVSSVSFIASTFDSDGSINSVEFFANGISIGQATRLGATSDWRLVYSFVNMGAGSYEITAIATDNSANIGTSAPLSLIVTGALSAAPSVSLATSAITATVNQSVLLTATATDADGSVTSVGFYANNVLLGTNAAPFNRTWTPTQPGTYRLEAIATDNTGNTTLSNSVTVTVNGSTPPTATLVVPVTRITRGSSLPISVETSLADGAVSAVAIFANGTSLSMDSAQSATWTPSSVGTYSLVGQVTDTIGNIVRTSAVSITVTAEIGQRPNGSLTLRPNNGEAPPRYTQGSSVVLSAIVGDADGSISSVILAVNGKVLATRTMAPYTATYTFASSDVGNVQFTAIIQDNDGNVQVASSDAVVYEISKQVPVITLTSPSADGSYALNSAVSVTATVATIDATLESVQFLKNGQVVATLTGAPYTATVTLDSSGNSEIRAVAYYNSSYYYFDSQNNRIEIDIATSGVSGARTLAVATPPGLLESAGFIGDVYENLFGRSATKGELASKSNLDAGTISQAQFLNNVVSGTEFTSYAYPVLLANIALAGSFPDYDTYLADLASWRAGTDLITYVSTVFASASYTSRYGPLLDLTTAAGTQQYTRVKALVTQIYQNLYGRDPSLSEIQAILTSINNNGTVGAIASFLNSNFIQKTDAAILKRIRVAGIFLALYAESPTMAEVKAFDSLTLLAIAGKVISFSEYWVPDRPSEFPVDSYLSLNEDLKAAYSGASNLATLAWRHYWIHGIGEGRVFDDKFRAYEYIRLYSDLSAAYGADTHKGVYQWLTAGKNEGRLGRVPVSFDAYNYLSLYPDLSVVYGADYVSAYLHYINHGVYEGRVFDDLFRANEYLEIYPDLKNAYGNDVGAAAIHWLLYGKSEGRSGRVPLTFDAAGYLARYPDLKNAYGSNIGMAYLHYINHGVYEGRVFDDLFRANEYSELYPDLKSAYGSDVGAAAIHWLLFGKAEGRSGRVPVTFDTAGYLARYPDLKSAYGSNAGLAYLHYINHGVYEGRVFDDFFRPAEYLAIYADLRSGYGSDLRAASLHWLYYGKAEGRKGRY